MRHASYQTNFIDYIIEPKGKHPSNICTLKNQAAKVKLKRCVKMLQSAIKNVKHAKVKNKKVKP